MWGVRCELRRTSDGRTEKDEDERQGKVYLIIRQHVDPTDHLYLLPLLLLLLPLLLHVLIPGVRGRALVGEDPMCSRRILRALERSAE